MTDLTNLSGGEMTRRLNVNLSAQFASELHDLARHSNRSMTELVRIGIGLVKLALAECSNGNKLIVTTEDGKPLKEVVL